MKQISLSTEDYNNLMALSAEDKAETIENLISRIMIYSTAHFHLEKTTQGFAGIENNFKNIEPSKKEITLNLIEETNKYLAQMVLATMYPDLLNNLLILAAKTQGIDYKPISHQALLESLSYHIVNECWKMNNIFNANNSINAN